MFDFESMEITTLIRLTSQPHLNSKILRVHRTCRISLGWMGKGGLNCKDDRHREVRWKDRRTTEIGFMLTSHDPHNYLAVNLISVGPPFHTRRSTVKLPPPGSNRQRNSSSSNALKHETSKLHFKTSLAPTNRNYQYISILTQLP